MESNQMQWQETVCDWCGTEESEFVFEGPDRLEGLGGSFRMVQCKQCGIFRQNPRLIWEALAKYYPENYASYQYSLEDQKNPLRTKFDNYGNVKRRRSIERFQPVGRILEVGCGTGAFLNELVQSGNWDVAGIEPNQKAAVYTQKTLNIPVFNGRFEDSVFEEGSFDAVVLWCVLEHLTEPIQDLRRAYSLLKEGGWLVFSMPHYESLDLRYFGKYWAGWDLPRHLYVFPRPVMTEILTSIGFHKITAQCISTNYYALGHSLEFWSQDWDEKQALKWNWILRIYRSWLTRAALSLPLAVLGRLNLASNITIFAQKK